MNLKTDANLIYNCGNILPSITKRKDKQMLINLVSVTAAFLNIFPLKQ